MSSNFPSGSTACRKFIPRSQFYCSKKERLPPLSLLRRRMRISPRGLPFIYDFQTVGGGRIKRYPGLRRNLVQGPKFLQYHPHTWSGIRQIWEIHATSLPGLFERLHEFPKSDRFPTMYDHDHPL